MLLRFLAPCLLLAAFSACTATDAPSGLLSADYIFSDLNADIDQGRTATDSTVSGLGLRYEFLRFSDNGNLAVSVQRREDEGDTRGSPTIEVDTLRLQAISHHALTDNLTWWFAIGGGYVLDASSNIRGEAYSGDLFYDFESALRLWLDPQFGIQAGANYTQIDLEGDNRGTPNATLGGVTFFGGIFLDL